MANEIKLPSIADLKTKFDKGMARLRPWHPEINLVPDVKNDMIKAIKLRNFTFFICIVVASASIAAIVVFASIAGGQQAIANGKKDTLDLLSSKMNGYNDLNDFITIKDQLSNLSAISSNKTLLSRAFNILSAIIPTSGDSITVSELSINLANESPTISFDAQANALTPPYIDYNVLDAFKKSMQYMRYDYGNYVDREGAKIPAYCIIEQGEDGATLRDENNDVYAFWLITGEGCNPSGDSEEDEAVDLEIDETTQNDDEESDDDSTDMENSEEIVEEEVETFVPETIDGYEVEDYRGQIVVRIWRTPRFSEWYKDEEVQDEPYMDLYGNISGVAHFESECTKYSGTKNNATGTVSWEAENSTCHLVPDNGINVSDSSNGRGASGELVLRFSATITLSPEFFKFSNNHMLAVGPSGRYNVTDSYVQIQNIFGAPATDCLEGDTACANTKGDN